MITPESAKGVTVCQVGIHARCPRQLAEDLLAPIAAAYGIGAGVVATEAEIFTSDSAEPTNAASPGDVIIVESDAEAAVEIVPPTDSIIFLASYAGAVGDGRERFGVALLCLKAAMWNLTNRLN
jgi:hypothetical protein